jgi:hypothetical protein
MKQLLLADGNEKLWITSGGTTDNKFTCINIQTKHADDFFVLLPQDLLQVRDWINERCRELQFHGHLPDNHLGD